MFRLPAGFRRGGLREWHRVARQPQRTQKTKNLTPVVLAASAAFALSACGSKERTAEADTSVAEAEVSTTMPAAAVSDAQLEAAANRAAANASQPAPGSTTTDGEPMAQDGN